jgi:hypothetical protein
MYRDPRQWAYVRRLVLEKGGSLTENEAQQEHRSKIACVPEAA